MKAEDKNYLHNIASCRYSDKALKDAGYDMLENPEFATMLADAYENGYTQCYNDMAERKCNPNDSKMTKEECNEYATIAYNAIAEIMNNYYSFGNDVKEALGHALGALGTIYNAPI